MVALERIIILCLLCWHQMLDVRCAESTNPSKTNPNGRQGKFFGLTSYLAGSSDGFRVAPFWKQWNAILHINIEKNLHKHNGVYVVPASLYYYPPNDQFGYYPPNLSGANNPIIPMPSNNNFPPPYRPMPVYFDDSKPPIDDTTTASLESDKTRFAIESYGHRIPINNFKYPKHISSNKWHGDRKTRKRNIDQKRKTNDDEIDAFVMEITDPSDDTTTTESIVMPSTDPITESIATTSAPTATDTIEILHDSTTKESETMPIELSSVLATMPTIVGAENGFKPTLDFYYGGTPNEIANSIYLTTSEPLEILDAVPNTDAPSNSADSNRFRPSIQYEYQNYRYPVDKHFIPIIGLKQIF